MLLEINIDTAKKQRSRTHVLLVSRDRRVQRHEDNVMPFTLHCRRQHIVIQATSADGATGTRGQGDDFQRLLAHYLMLAYLLASGNLGKGQSILGFFTPTGSNKMT